MVGGAPILRAAHVVLGDEIDRPRFDLGQHLADVLADHPDHDELHTAQHHQADDHRRIAGDRFAVDQRLIQDRGAEDQRAGGEQHAEQARQPQRRDRKRRQPLDRQPDQAGDVPTGAAMLALGRLVVDPQLPKADPARQSLEEAVALRQPAQRIGRARRQEPEIAGVVLRSPSVWKRYPA